jgi:adenosylhomocysteine nucleosidase
MPGPTAILSALAQEQEGLIDQLQNAQCVQRAGREFWCGVLGDHPVVLALSRIGKVAAATTTAALIESFGVSRVVFTGVAGGVGPDVRVGDVVVGSSFLQHDMDASPLFPRYEIPLYGQTLFAADVDLTAVLLRASQAAKLISTNGQLPSIHHGLIASGDRFVSSAVEALALVQALQSCGHQPLAVEMEGAAVAQVCADYGVPFAAVRTISDRADDEAHVDFPKFIAEIASVYARSIVMELMQSL